MSNFIVDLIF